MVEIDKRLLIIANGRKKKSEREAIKMAKVAQNRGYFVDLHITKNANRAQELLAGDISSFDAIVALGGDGTVLPVVEELRNKILENNAQTDPHKIKRVPVLVAPKNSIGSSQVLSTELGMPSNPEAVMDVIEGGQIQRVHLGTVSIDDKPAEIFVSNATAGLSGEMFDRDRSKKQRGGLLGYAPSIPRVIRHADYVGGKIAVINERDDHGRIKYGVNRSGERVTDIFVHNAGNIGVFPLNRSNRYDSGDLAAIVFHGSTGNPRKDALRQANSIIHDSIFSTPARNEDRIQGIEIVITDLAHDVKVQRDGDFLGVAKKSIRFGTDVVAIDVFRA